MHALAGCVLVLCALLPGLAAAAQLNAEELAGKRIFLHGSSDSGADIHALVGATGMSLPASALPCASCHGVDGLGRPEGGIRPPPISWQRLRVAYGQQRNGRYYPAYDERSLARAVTDGLDSAGNQLDPAMPRFVMSARDMRALIAYLKRLEDDRDPGVAAEQLHLATLLPDTAAGRSLQALLRSELQRINAAGGIHGRRLELHSVAPGPSAASALEALRGLLQRQQVFALVAPLLPAVDQRFTELLGEQQLPLIGPLLADSAGLAGPMVFRILPDAQMQLDALGQFAGSRFGQGAALVLHTPGDTFSTQAEHLATYLGSLGWRRVDRLVHSHQPDLSLLRAAEVVFFVGSEQDFISLGQTLQQATDPWLLALSSQVAGAARTLPPSVAERVWLAYPFTPADWTAAGIDGLRRAAQQPDAGRYLPLQVAALAAVRVLDEGLRRAGRDLSRARLVSSLEGLHGFSTGLTPALTYGPGQRLGASGAHVVQLDLGSQHFRLEGDYVRVQPNR